MAIKTATSIDNFGLALKAMLQARAGLANVIVADGPPPPGQFEAREWIALFDVEFEQTPHSLNTTNRPRIETYRQKVLVSVVQETRSDQATPTARAFVLFSEIADALRADPELSAYYTGDGLIDTAQIGSGTVSKRANADATARETAIEFEINVKARI